MLHHARRRANTEALRESQAHFRRHHRHRLCLPGASCEFNSASWPREFNGQHGGGGERKSGERTQKRAHARSPWSLASQRGNNWPAAEANGTRRRAARTTKAHWPVVAQHGRRRRRCTTMMMGKWDARLVSPLRSSAQLNSTQLNSSRLNSIRAPLFLAIEFRAPPPPPGAELLFCPLTMASTSVGVFAPCKCKRARRFTFQQAAELAVTWREKCAHPC